MNSTSLINRGGFSQLLVTVTKKSLFWPRFRGLNPTAPSLRRGRTQWWGEAAQDPASGSRALLTADRGTSGELGSPCPSSKERRQREAGLLQKSPREGPPAGGPAGEVGPVLFLVPAVSSSPYLLPVHALLSITDCCPLCPHGHVSFSTGPPLRSLSTEVSV